MEPYNLKIYKQSLLGIHDVIIFLVESFLEPIYYRYIQLQEDLTCIFEHYFMGDYIIRIFFFFCKHFSLIMPILGSC